MNQFQSSQSPVPSTTGYQQYQQSPIMPPPTPRRSRKKSRRPLWIGIVAVAIIIIIAAVLESQGKQPTTTTPKTQTTTVNNQSTPVSQPTAQPTIKSTQTVTPSTSASPAIIGADMNAFIAKYGQPNTSQGGDTFGNLSVTFDNNRAIAILDQSPNTGWSKSVALASCLALAPSDVKYQRQMTLLDPQGNLQAFQRVYFSRSLAPLLPTNDFTDENGNPDEPGTFGIVLNVDATNTNIYDSCSIQSVLQQK